MNKEEIHELILKYNAGQADPSELKQIEQLIENGKIELNQLYELNLVDEQIQRVEYPSPSLALDHKFHEMLREEKSRSRPSLDWKSFFSMERLFPRLALASVLIVVGFIGGYFTNSSSLPEDDKVSLLTQQIADLQEMVMLSLLEKESATDRLKAVNLTHEMDEASTQVTKALLKTLNHDENVNVRLAALEALKPYTKEGQVREELIHSIGKQESPLVQVALAELMGTLQEKSSVEELQKILRDDKTPEEIKKKIQETIQVMI